ncbi:unnamed protein product [Rangifer tarandus platyrhynchus]|uniref:Uncharacterized protein n=1 Tax=Rangifer tarandus platyrhynchus TaxID=3082113 RepID=A0AC59ZW85_RANTA
MTWVHISFQGEKPKHHTLDKTGLSFSAVETVWGKWSGLGGWGRSCRRQDKGTVCPRAGGARAFDINPPSTLQSTLSDGHPQVINSLAHHRLQWPPALWVQRPLTGVYPRGLSEACRAEGSCISLHKPLPLERQEVDCCALCRRLSSVSITTPWSPALLLCR